MAKTKPMKCPCCESKSEICFRIDWQWIEKEHPEWLSQMKTSLIFDAPKKFQVVCKSCGISTPYTEFEKTAIEVWNTRPNHNKIFRTFSV